MAVQAFFNSDGTELTAVITVVGSDGNHVDPDSWPIANDPAIVLSSHTSAAKTITKVDTGVYTAEWTGLSPALNNGDVVNIAIDGSISSTAWTTWRSFLQVVRLPSSQASVDTIDTVVDAIKLITDQFNFTVPGQVDANALTGGGGDDAATIYSHFTNSTNADAFKADVSSLASQSSVDTVDSVVDAVKAVTDQFNFTVSGQVDANALSGGGAGGDDAATIYAHFTNSTNADAFKADVSALASQASVDGLNDVSAADVYSEFTAAANADAFKADVSSLASQASVDGLNDLSAADVTAAVPTAVEIRSEIDSGSTVLAAILADTDELQSDDVPGLIAALNNLSVADLLTTPMVESYAADGAAPTLTQAILLTLQHMSESSVLGTTKTVKRLDGFTDAATFTLDDANDPSSITRTS